MQRSLAVSGVELRRRGDNSRGLTDHCDARKVTDRIEAQVLTQLTGDNVAGIGHLDRVTVRCRGGRALRREHAARAWLIQESRLVGRVAC